jgi:hypothetical protein
VSEPILFISHFRIKGGALDGLKAYSGQTTKRLEDEKPRTLLFGSYLDEDQREISFVHAFADAASMDAHFEGSNERARAAYEFIEPLGWEFYGSPSAAALESMQKAAAAADVPLTVHSEFLAGFVRLVAG